VICLAENSLYITCNIFEANFLFNKNVDGFDFFKVEGIGYGADRFKSLSKVIARIQNQEKVPFAPYLPAPNGNFAVGHLQKPPRVGEFEVDGLRVAYYGQDALLPSQAGRRTVTELLNKSKSKELRQILWSPGGHTFYPKTGRNLNDVTRYRGCNLTMFRGPFFRYNVLSNGKIILSLDSSTHYTSSEPFLKEIGERGGLKWFVKEIEHEREAMEIQRRVFKGVHFFYDLYKNDVAIDGIDERPISEIPLSKQTVINGIECGTIAQYLRAQYSRHPGIGALDDSQPGLKGGDYVYPPQFLYRTVPLQQIPDNVLNDQTFFMDWRPRKLRDIQRPAIIRWEKTMAYYLQYNFKCVDLGTLTLKMSGPLKFPTANHFEKPRLKAKSGEPIRAEDITKELSKGLYAPPKIDRTYLYSLMDSGVNQLFYEGLGDYAKSRYNVSLPPKAIPLERNLVRMRNQLENSISAQGAKGSFCIALIPQNSDLHDEITNICGKVGVPSKCVTMDIVERVSLEGISAYLRDTVASIIARAGGIPWILYDKLHYGCYIATDVGRSKSEYWAMSIVYDQDGKFAVEQGELIVGEDLDAQSVRRCVTEAQRYASSSDTIIYLRDGEIFDKERGIFEDTIDGLRYSRAAIVSIKENVPFRIYRMFNAKIMKPLSGDYYFLDDKNAVLCAAGSDIYEHGTPKPIVAEVIPVKGDIDVRALTEDVFKLAFLNWGSPGRSYSVPAPIRMAHESASELSSGVRRSGLPI
jgi:hypothetical protein